MSLAKLEAASAHPSMRPRAADAPPRVTTNNGRTEVAISCPTSEKRLATPMPSTLRLSQRARVGGEAGEVIPNRSLGARGGGRARRILDDPYFFYGDQAFAHHGVDDGEHSLDAFWGIHDFHHQG